MAKIPNRLTTTSKPILKKDTLYNLMIFICISSTLLFVYISKQTIVSLYDLSKIVLLFCCGGFLIPMKIHKNLFDFGRIEAAIFNVIFGIFLLSLIATSNFLIVSDSQIQTMKITNINQDWNRFAGNSILVALENDVLNDYPEFRRFDIHENNKEILNASIFEVKIAKGIFGFDVVKNIELK